ncbi:MAG: metallophosphoesterase family protein [candidate division WOR-3 bacterium]
MGYPVDELNEQKFRELIASATGEASPDLACLRSVMLSPYRGCFIPEWTRLLFLLASRVRLWHALERQTPLLKGAVYDLMTSSPVIAIGDLHGDIEALWEIVEKEDVLEDVGKCVVFLGDYIDRGPMQLSTLALPLFLKALFPERVFLLRGNHDEWLAKEESFAPVVDGEPDALFVTFWQKYLPHSLLLELHHLLDELPVVLQLNRRIGIVHGGPPRPTSCESKSYASIRGAESLNCPRLLYEMRWCRPEDKEDVFIIGDANFAIGRCHFEAFIERLGWDLMIRGHDPVFEGFQLLPAYQNRLLTIHSTGRKEADSENTAFPYVSPAYAEIEDNAVTVHPVFGPRVRLAKLSISSRVSLVVDEVKVENVEKESAWDVCAHDGRLNQPDATCGGNQGQQEMLDSP